MNIVLAHGILGFRTLLNHIDYFNGVKAHLEKDTKIKVLVTEVSPVNGIFVRGDALSRQITDALNAGLPDGLDPRQKTHIIAHSMGGLDSRYILSPKNTSTNIADRVSSLTTIGTPHRGSPIADLIFSGFDGEAPLPGLKELEGKIRNDITKIVSLDGLSDLTVKKCSAFDEEFEDNPNVSYFSIAGIGRKFSLMRLLHFDFASTCQLLLATHEYLKLKTKEENDGAVALSSAQKYKPIGEAWPTDHFDEVGHNLDRLPLGKPIGFDYLAKYTEIANRLSQIK